MSDKTKKYEITTSTAVEAADDTSALVHGLRIFKNLDTELICDVSKVRLGVRPIEDIEKGIK